MATLLFVLEILLFSCTLILSIEVCNSKSIVVVSKYIYGSSTLQSFAVCNPCGPGFEASETCLAGLRTSSHAIVQKSKVSMFFGDEDLNVSQCRPCRDFHYSNTHGINKTCKTCSFCDYEEETRPCTPTTDTVCGTAHVFNTTVTTRRRSMKPIVWNILPASEKMPEVTTTIPWTLTLNPLAERLPANYTISLSISVSIFVCLTIVNLFILYMVRKRWKATSAHEVSLEGCMICPREVTSMEVASTEVTSMEVADTHTSCSDLRLKSNLSSPEPTSQQFFSSDVENLYAIPASHSLKLEDMNVFTHNCTVKTIDVEIPTTDLSVPLHNYTEDSPDAEIPTTSDDRSTCEPRTCSLDSGVAGCCSLPRARSTNSTLSRFGSTDSEIDEECRITLEASNTFGYEGGALRVEGSSVSIKIPKGAIPRGETKAIQAKVHVCRPHDWKELRESGYSIGLPQVELGPDGSTFLKPIEVIFENSPSDVPEDTVFEFAEGGVNNNATFQEATRASTRKEAKQAAMKVSPHVAFFAGEQNLHAFYMHFTRGRKKAKLKEIVLKVAMFMKVDDFLGRTLQLVVAFYEPTPEGLLILKNGTSNLKEVNVISKAITVKAKDGSVKTAIKTLGEKWTVNQGEDTQECLLETIFGPKYHGILPVIDYIFEAASEREINGFRCTLDVMQMEKKKTDLKIVLDKEYLKSIANYHNLSMSSGYQSSGETHLEESHTIEDSEFVHFEEPRDYIQQVFLRLKDYVGANYREFSRKLGVPDCDINTMKHDHASFGAKEICYQIMMSWLNAQENGPDFKASMMAKIQKALDKTEMSCKIILPSLDKAVMVQRETTV